jgi:hypothetical protein
MGGMTRDDLLFWITVLSAACWIVCFWWMHRISARQDALLARIERLSKVEHDLIREVHPQVGEIKQAVDQVASKVNGT